MQLYAVRPMQQQARHLTRLRVVIVRCERLYDNSTSFDIA